MMKKDLGIDISVIMPVYNSEKYIGEAICSMLLQTFDNFEFIIVDDASTDGTAFIINTYINEGITVIRNNKNIGNYPSRNIGLQHATGKYICVMDADDVASPDRLELQYLYMESHPELLASGSWYFFSFLDGNIKTPVSNCEISMALLKNNCFLHSSLILRADIMRLIGGYDEKYVYSADYDLICRLVLLGEVANYPVPLMMYRWHSAQISQLYRIEQATYAGAIRKNYHIAIIDKYKKAGQPIPDEMMVEYPDVGCIICLYTFAQFTGDNQYEEQADILLEKIFEEIGSLILGNYEKKLCALGCGLIYLLRNGFAVGDENEVLMEIDQRLSWLSISWDNRRKEELYSWIHYLKLRLSAGNKDMPHLCNLVNTQNLICLLDYLEQTDLRGNNRMLMADLKVLYEMKVYPLKIGQLLDDYREAQFVTFIIPVRIDSLEREENLDTVVALLSAKKNVQILITEGDVEMRYQLKASYPNVTYKFVEDHDPIFHRTKYLNGLLNEARTRIVGVWDTDVIVPEEQMDSAIEKIWTKNAVMSFPYDGRFYMISPVDSAQFRKKYELPFLVSCIDHIDSFATNSVGGAFFVDKYAYLNVGGENEHFYGWGAEDLERVKRMEIVGLPIFRSKGPLFHLYHPRKENSWYGNQNMELQSRKEFLKICSMTQQELYQYIQSWR